MFSLLPGDQQMSHARLLVQLVDIFALQRIWINRYVRLILAL